MSQITNSGVPKWESCFYFDSYILRLNGFTDNGFYSSCTELWETGWQTFTYVFDNDFEGNFSIVVSNFGDNVWWIILLVDNISDIQNGSFEQSPPFKWFTVSGNGQIVHSATSLAGTLYMPTDRNHMAMLNSWGKPTEEVSWTILESTLDGVLDYSAGESWSFDWAFLRMTLILSRISRKSILRPWGEGCLQRNALSSRPHPGDSPPVLQQHPGDSRHPEEDIKLVTSINLPNRTHPNWY